MSNPVIIWKNPPAKHQGKKAAQPDYRATKPVTSFVDRLKARPNRWGLYPTPMRSSSHVTEHARRFPGTEWTLRAREDGRWDLYGRFTG